jgi:hypothetical protein
VPRVLRPLEGIIAERLVGSRERQPGTREQSRVLTCRRIVRPNYWAVRSRVAVGVGKPFSPFDPVHIAGALPAAEDGACLKGFIEIREALFLLGAGGEWQEYYERDEIQP